MEDALVELAHAAISGACWLAAVYWIGRPLVLLGIDLAKAKYIPTPPPRQKPREVTP